MTISPPRRERSGRRQRPSKTADIQAAQRKREEAEKSVVLSQPHRRGNTDQRCASKVGLYMLTLQGHAGYVTQCQDAYDELRGIVRRWRMLKGLPDPETSKYREGGVGDVDEAVISRLHGRWMDAVSYVRAMAGNEEAVIVKTLCEEYAVPPAGLERKTIRGLISLARHFGMM
jgi:hypothetical protein